VVLRREGGGDATCAAVVLCWAAGAGRWHHNSQVSTYFIYP